MAKRALVLAGGGSRGSYQIGVCQALRELSIDFQIVTGTSVGALNGALMVQGDFDIAQELWEHLTNKDVIRLDGIEIADKPLEGDREERRKFISAFLGDVVQKGGADVAPLEEIIQLYLDEDKIRNASTDFGLITVEYPSFKELKLTKGDIPPGKMKDFLLATAACFPAFRAREIEGVQYIDGGYYDNIPIELAISMGAEEVIAVDLEGIGLHRKANQKDIPITYIRCHWNLGNFLLFEKDTTRRNIILGYNDTMKTFGQRDGMAYTFQKGEALRNARSLRAAYESHLQRITPPEGKGLGNAMINFAYQSVLEEIRKLRKLQRTMPLSEAVTACGEICAELLGLDPVPVYTFSQFNKEILDIYRSLADEGSQAIAAAIGKEMNIREIIQLIQSIDRRHVACFIADRMEAFLAGEVKDKDIALLAVAFPKAAAAALYINVLVYELENPPALLNP